ncbi:hypothetical protein ACMX2H_07630 [Arthrobacter sulfonylureivorans]|uniref:hypothetical protein n=1 Tax=Arthrobacter sulfonylureivorans TaxID=2486855 RepID=UPI0039E5A54F
MLQTPSAAFEPSKASVSADGLLTLSGTVSSSREQPGDYSFILAVRGTKAEREYEAQTSQETGGTEQVSCRIPLADLGAAPGEFVDLYFQSRHGSGAVRTRVSWQLQSLRWLPYPTKFGNLSFKRKAV